MAVVTISRQEGTGGEEIAARVAGWLGFTLIDKDRVRQLLDEADLGEVDPDIFEERPLGFVDRFDENRRAYREFIRSSLIELAEEDDLVMLGRGGQYLFRHAPDTLHIKVIASWEHRIEQVCSTQSVSPREAARILRKNDRERARYLRDLYGEDGSDPSLYDLIIRMDRISLHDAVGLITRSAELLGLRSSRGGTPPILSELAPIEHPTTKKPFANRAEATFARVLDFYKTRWEYEPRSFPLEWDEDGNVIEAFTPDFYLPDQNLYIELTTLKQSLVTKKNRKLRRLRELYPDVTVKLFYKKDYRSLLEKYGLVKIGEDLQISP
jgi:cytidylate kinase